MYILV